MHNKHTTATFKQQSPQTPNRFFLLFLSNYGTVLESKSYI